MHRFIDFKGFREASLDLFRPFTILIGRNGSGKTNAIEGVELLAQLGRGTPLYEITDVGRGGAFELRGGIGGCATSRADLFTLQLDANSLMPGGEDLAYSVTVRARPESRIAKESLRLGSRVLFETLDGGEQDPAGVLTVRYHNFDRGPNKPLTKLPADRSVLSQFGSFADGPKLAVARDAVRVLQDYFRATFVFDPSPAAMRGYDRIGNRTLTRTGSSLSPVLHALNRGTESEQAALARILDRIRQLPEEPYQDFAFVSTQLDDVQLALVEAPDRPSIEARRLSDGTLRALAVLTAMETTPSGSRIVLEEFDTGVHPSRVGVLTQAIQECATRRSLNVLCTTHNPATLDALDASQFAGVVITHRNEATKALEMTRLLDMTRSDALLESGRLGDLVTRRVIERHLAPGFDEDVRRKAKQWIENLSGE